MDHSGHRDRVKAQFARHGIAGFSEVKILEMLLYYVIPRRDTVPLAEALLEEFGSLVNVLDAPMEALTKIPGMGENSAMYLRYIMAVFRHCFSQQNKINPVMDTIESCAEYLTRQLRDLRQEVVYVLCLDGQCRCVGSKAIGEGSVNSARVSIERIVEYCQRTRAYSVVLAHNHPGGLATPSTQDIGATIQIAEALGRAGITLVDHLIITNEDYTSMAESGVLCGFRSRTQRMTPPPLRLNFMPEAALKPKQK